MDRSLENTIQLLLDSGKDAYDILEIDRNASNEVIRSAYRKKALKFHPDKNNGIDVNDRFKFVSLANIVLSNDIIRKEYDIEVEKRKISTENTNPSVHKFKSDLRNRESRYKAEQQEQYVLRQQAVNLSDRFDDYLKHTSTYPSINHEKNRDRACKIVSVKWKNKVVFDENLLSKLMGVFGPVENVTTNPGNKVEDNHHYAKVEFKSSVGASLAATHDYSVTTDHWNHLNLRKVSSLLRSATLLEAYDNQLENENPSELSYLDYISYSILARA